MFKNLKVRSKLFFSYCVILIFYIVAIIASSVGLGSVFTGLENFYNVPYPMMESARGSLTPNHFETPSKASNGFHFLSKL